MKIKVIEEYCTGCGLCKSLYDVNFVFDTNGFPIPDIKNDDVVDFCKKVCPANGNHLMEQSDDSWGKYVGVYEGYALNDEIRFKAASGGVTTAIAVYLLESGKVDGIIQIGESNRPFDTKVYCSRSKKEVIQNSASRYITSSPLSNFTKIVMRDEKYAFIGRPCDAVVLRNFLDNNPQYKNNIICILSFFCAGAPNSRASRELCIHLGIKPNEVKHIQYRGQGWPGKATVESITGEIRSMEYIDSWNNILGRDIRKICKFCSDGVGEAADIASGDLWYLDDMKKPVFDNMPGRNVIFARSNKGKRLLIEAMEQGYISLTNFEHHIEDLNYIQPNHAIRKKLLFARCLAMKFMHRSVPNYNVQLLKKMAKGRSLKDNFKTFCGTIKRVLCDKL